MKCVLCIYTLRHGQGQDAVTVAGGYAVCDDHLGYATQGTDWYYMLKHAREAEESERGQKHAAWCNLPDTHAGLCEGDQ